jgi:hypothetical protein
VTAEAVSWPAPAPARVADISFGFEGPWITVTVRIESLPHPAGRGLLSFRGSNERTHYYDTGRWTEGGAVWDAYGEVLRWVAFNWKIEVPIR